MIPKSQNITGNSPTAISHHSPYNCRTVGHVESSLCEKVAGKWNFVYPATNESIRKVFPDSFNSMFI